MVIHKADDTELRCQRLRHLFNFLSVFLFTGKVHQVAVSMNLVV